MKTLTPLQNTTINPNAFFVWSVLSLNLYTVYWAWQMWEAVRSAEGKTYKCPSWLRAIGLPISAFWLFPKLHALTGKSEWPLDPPYLATLYFVINLAITIVSYSEFGASLAWLLIAIVVGTLPLYLVVQAVARSNKPEVVVNHLPKKENYALLVILCVVLALGLLGYVLKWLGV